MRIGINTGKVIVGNIGSDRRMKYAAVGNEVNLPGPIESTGGQILISESTHLEVATAAAIGRNFQVEAKGAREPLTVWEITGIGDDHALLLRPHAALLVELTKPIPIRFAVLKGKHLRHDIFEGSIVRLSQKGVEVCSSATVQPFDNVKIWIPGIAGVTGDVEVYAKVGDGAPAHTPGFAVRFTALPPEVERHSRAGWRERPGSLICRICSRHCAAELARQDTQAS